VGTLRSQSQFVGGGLLAPTVFRRVGLTGSNSHTPWITRCHFSAIDRLKRSEEGVEHPEGPNPSQRDLPRTQRHDLPSALLGNPSPSEDFQRESLESRLIKESLRVPERGRGRSPAGAGPSGVVVYVDRFRFMRSPALCASRRTSRPSLWAPLLSFLPVRTIRSLTSRPIFSDRCSTRFPYPSFDIAITPCFGENQRSSIVKPTLDRT
jgi:hypothetical protein